MEASDAAGGGPDGESKACPLCAETIKAAAIRCRFCHADLTASAATASSPPHTDADAPVQCPRCKSSQIAASEKGVGLGKAAAGGILLGPVGLAAGLIGRKDLRLSCMKCGHRWDPNNPGFIDSLAIAADKARADAERAAAAAPEGYKPPQPSVMEQPVQSEAGILAVVVIGFVVVVLAVVVGALLHG